LTTEISYSQSSLKVGLLYIPGARKGNYGLCDNTKIQTWLSYIVTNLLTWTKESKSEIWTLWAEII